MTRTWWRSSLNSRTLPCWAPLDTRPIGAKSDDAAPWTKKGPCSKSTIADISPDPYESRLYKLSVKSKNSPIGVRMKSWQPLQLGSVL
jgi:hypothetical protein